MKKILVALTIALMTLPAFADRGHHGGGGWAGPLVLGGIIGYALSPKHEPQVIVQHGNYPQVWIPVQPQLTQPRVYNLGYPPPFPGARPMYQESWQFEPSCQCQVKIYNQIGWQ